MKAELVPENGDPPIPIMKDMTVIGRREYCDVRIDHPSLSKRHCVVVKTDGLLVIRDLATTNGTKVKGQKVRWAALLPDDRIAFGGYKVRVYLGPDDLPAPSELPNRTGKTVRQVSPFASPAAPPSLAPAQSPASGFPAPSPLTGMPVLVPEGQPLEILDDDEPLEILRDEDTDDSEWRNLIRLKPGEDDAVIELD